MTIVDYYFASPGAGSFELSLFQAWFNAGNKNRRRLEYAFPEYFPVAIMYGAGDFRDFANKKDLEEALKEIK